MLRRVAPEEGFPAEHLREDAPHGPDVDGRAVVLGLAEQLGRAVPPRHHVFGELARVVVDAARQSEIADRQIAVAVHEEVRRFQVPVQHVRRVDVLQAPQDLVEEVLVVLVRQGLPRGDDAIEVGLHQIGDDVHVLEVDRVRGHRHQILHLHDVLVAAEVAQELDFPQDSFRVHQVAEDVRYLFDGYAPPGRRVVRGAHDAVGPAADRPQIGVAHVDVKLVPAQRHAVVLPSERHFGEQRLMIQDGRGRAFGRNGAERSTN